ncbi:MAG: hypothetical protein JWO57_4365 [Pseudonocardiales bacterium]|nr:hypothetical protein [Pseudonocardiales bacterium]
MDTTAFPRWLPLSGGKSAPNGEKVPKARPYLMGRRR